MKRNVFVLLVMALLCLPFGNAFAAGGAPPQFGITTDGIKLGDIKCDTWRNGMHGLIVDGSNVYAIRLGGLFTDKEVIMDKSNDGGLTWINSAGIARGAEIESCSSGIAIDPVTKALHYVWDTHEPLLSPSQNTYYGNGTITTRVNGSVNVYPGASVIAVGGNGVIHIVFAGPGSIYYAASSDNGLTFSAPTAFTSSDFFSLSVDSAGNLSLAYKGYYPDPNHYFIKKPVGGSWSIPYTVCSGCTGNDPSMAVYDSNRIYMAIGGTIAATSNGGQTWTLNAVPNYDPSSWPHSSLAVDSNGLLNFAWSKADGAYFAKTTKSHDPSSWGPAVLALAGGDLPNVAVDSAGKAYIMARKGGYPDIAAFTKEK